MVLGCENSFRRFLVEFYGGWLGAFDVTRDENNNLVYIELIVYFYFIVCISSSAALSPASSR